MSKFLSAVTLFLMSSLLFAATKEMDAANVRFRPELVARVALCCAVQRFMRCRERSRRNLSVNAGGAEDNSSDNEQESKQPERSHRADAGVWARCLRTRKRH